MSYINQVIILQCGTPSCTLPKKSFLSPLVWVRGEYIWKLNWKESLLIYFEKRPSLSLYLAAHLKEELTDYFFILKVTRILPIPTQAKKTKDGDHFANDWN